MNNDFINEELSAYLDGESDDPASVGRILSEDPESALRYAQMAALSSHLRNLPAPDVSPAFATRVLAHVREEAEEHRSRWFTPHRLAWGLAGFGFVIVLAVSLALFARSGPRDHERGANPMMATLTEPGAMPEMDPAAMPPDMQQPEYSDSSESEEITPEDEYRDTLASVQWLEQVEETYVAPPDLDTMLDSLSDSEIKAFKTLLAEYAEGSRSI